VFLHLNEKPKPNVTGLFFLIVIGYSCIYGRIILEWILRKPVGKE
jgi:hypothetical protein